MRKSELAQLVERLVRNEKVSGSNPLCSTCSAPPNGTCILSSKQFDREEVLTSKIDHDHETKL